MDWASQLPALGAIIVIFGGIVVWMERTIDSLRKDNSQLQQSIVEKVLPALNEATQTQKSVVTVLEVVTHELQRGTRK